VKESNIQTLLGRYIKDNQPNQSLAIELKFTKTKSIRWDSVADHQVKALLHVSGNDGMYYKEPDMTSMGGFSHPKPFDCWYLRNIKAYVGCCFYIPRKPKKIYLIPIDVYLELQDHAPRMSFREDDLLHDERIKVIKL
jgi:penicillin-binding protein-related factor A (putative recombinase)